MLVLEQIYGERIGECAQKAIKERVFPGCMVGVVRRDGTREVMPFGNFTYEHDSVAINAFRAEVGEILLQA